MTEHDTHSGSIDVRLNPFENVQIYGNGEVAVSGPTVIHPDSDFDPLLRLSLWVEDEPIEEEEREKQDVHAYASVSLTREQARSIGQALVDASHDKVGVLFEE